MYDIIIVGGGPAGLSAAIYSCRAGKSVLVLEKNVFGGRIIYAADVKNYPGVISSSGAAIAENMLSQAKSFGAEMKNECVNEISFSSPVCVKTSLNEYLGKSVIIATGTVPRKSGAANEDSYIGRGVSYCALCDGAFFKGGTVSVIGGGNTALTDALYLSSICKKVYLIHRRNTFRGEKSIIDKVMSKPNISLLLNKKVIEISGGDTVEKIVVSDNQSGKTTSIDTDGVFIAAGSEPDTSLFGGVLDISPGGYIITDEACRTKFSHVFSAGDCRKKDVRQLSTAISDGCIAASMINDMENSKSALY